MTVLGGILIGAGMMLLMVLAVLMIPVDYDPAIQLREWLNRNTD